MSNAVYHFIPQLRKGLSSFVRRAATSKRLFLDLKIKLQGNRVGSQLQDEDEVIKRLELIGPADIIGFREALVTRTDPLPNVGDFEPNFFPAIEFADPDFGWRLTPQPPNGNDLPPWISLIVLVSEQGQEEFEEGFTDTIRTGKIKIFNAGNLPDLNFANRWAHVQVTGGSDETITEVKEELSRKSSVRVVSRLICARRLRPGIAYTAFVVPTFELGRKAGLDQSVDGIAAASLAWNGSETDWDLPYYYKWEFRTGMRGDFEHLIRLLEPRKLSGLGVRSMNCGTPGFNISGVNRTGADPEEVNNLDLEGALRSLDTEFTEWGYDADPVVVEPFQTEIAAKLLNQPVDLLNVHPFQFSPTVLPPELTSLTVDLDVAGTAVFIKWSTAESSTGVIDFGDTIAYDRVFESNTDATEHEIKIEELEPEKEYHFSVKVIIDGVEIVTDDQSFQMLSHPIVAPPIYGKWHASKYKVENLTHSDFWLNHVNRDPRHRAAAGLGSEVVRRDQEELMASAWEQLGAIESANATLRNAQFGRVSARSLYERLGMVKLEELLQITSPVFKKIRKASPDSGDSDQKSINGHLKENSDVAAFLFDPGFRRISRKRGPLRRRQKVRPDNLESALRRVLDCDLQPAGNHPKPDGTVSLCDITETFKERDFTNLTENPSGDIPGPDYDGVGGGLTDDSNPITGGPIITPPINFGDIVIVKFCENEINVDLIDQAFNDTSREVFPSNAVYRDGVGVLASGIESDQPLTEFQENLKPAILQALEELKPQPQTPCKKPDALNEFLDEITNRVQEALHPETTITNRVKKRLKLRDDLKGRFEEGYDGDPLDGIMAAPVFPQPMYEPLRDISHELILPGVQKIPMNTLGLLETNRRFLESYCLGLNHECAAELLWRNYPTDQRGTYFRQFWDVSDLIPIKDSDGTVDDVFLDAPDNLKDIKEIPKWGNSKLGENSPRPGQEEGLVLVVRGDLLKKYPNTNIYAVHAAYHNGRLKPQIDEFIPGSVFKPKYPIFKANLPPDLTFFGFSITEEEAKDDPGIFFVIEERISEPRFGMDTAIGIADVQTGLTNWNDLSWAYIADPSDNSIPLAVDKYVNGISPDTVDDINPDWNHSGTIAKVTCQKPVRIIVHASQMIPDDP